MDIRGERECKSCGTHWSYYETGEIACPECNSLHSVGVDEPKTHTEGQASLDLTPVRNAVDTEPIRRVATEATALTRRYIKTVGFVSAGELEPLVETFLTAMELRRVGTTVRRLRSLKDTQKAYFLELLRGADRGERPGPKAVPQLFYPERGLAVAASIDIYTTEIRRWREERTARVDQLLSTVRARRKRIEALDGDVDPADAERLVRTVRDLSRYLRVGDEDSLARAQERLSDDSL
jgi:uncharacterized Zn finger protein (UPF0148 family)